MVVAIPALVDAMFRVHGWGFRRPIFFGFGFGYARLILLVVVLVLILVVARRNRRR